mgnify:FL=1
MTPAELKTLREACGLPQSWLAHQAQVNERTVRYWESGKSSVPDDVAALISRIDTQLDTAARGALEQAQALATAHGEPQDVTLYRYDTDAELWERRPDMAGLPVTCHAALLARARRLLSAAGFRVVIAWA